MRMFVSALGGVLLVLACAAEAAAQTPFAAETGRTASRAQAVAPVQAFPEGARLGFVDLPRVANLSSQGQAMVAKIEEFRNRKTAEVSERGKKVEALQAKLWQAQSVLDDRARIEVERAFQRARIDFQRAAEVAQAEIQDLQQELQRQFTARLFPIIGQVAKDRNLWAVFSTESVAWHDPELDLSDEVAKRLDAAAKEP